MKLSFLQNVNEFDEHYIRLNDFDLNEAALFRNIIQSLIDDKDAKPVNLSRFEFIECVKCRLTLRISESDEGIVTEDFRNFYCDLSRLAYKDMIKLIDPFCIKQTDAYRFLYDLDNPIDFLFSAGKEHERNT